MISDGYIVGDGSWELRVFVTDLQVDRPIRVKGDLHIGGVMFKLVEDLDIAMDWSDHALWWPRRNMWLSRTRSTLDQYGVQADALLHFTPMHKTLRVQLPDLRYLDARVDFSIKTFNAVVYLCKELGMQHPEEISFCKPLTSDDLKRNYQELPGKKRNTGKPSPIPADTNTFIASNSSNNSLDSTGNDNHSTPMCAPVSSKNNSHKNNTSTPISSPVSTGTWKKNNSPYSEMNGSYSPHTPVLHQDGINGTDLSISLAQSPPCPSREVRNSMVRPKSLLERARMNVAWLDSSLSIMEQGVKAFDTLLLRFKFYSIFDLNPKSDPVRITQLYEQAKWQLLNEETDCTEEEMLMFAALQLQVNLQVTIPQASESSPVDDDIDAALTDLQVSLEGNNIHTGPNNIMHIPELGDYLRFLKPKRFTLKGFKRYWVVCRDIHLTLYKSPDEDTQRSEPVSHYNLRGCEVTPDVNLSQGKFGIKLEVPGADGMTEMWIRCDSEQKYASWLAACRLASKGKTLADSSYESEVQSILAFLSMQHPAPAPVINPDSYQINADEYIAPRFLKKGKNKLLQRILEAHANVKDYTLVEAKLNYIKAWQSLPDYGVSLFVVKFMGHKKEELLGVAYNRIMWMDLNTGDHIKTWRYSTMKAWNVNWEVKHMMIQFEQEKDIVFNCLSSDCKVVHEFIGGYIFLSMRSKDANQSLNEELFHKLTGGWS